jgi:O-antigen ligase
MEEDLRTPTRTFALSIRFFVGWLCQPKQNVSERIARGSAVIRNWRDAFAFFGVGTYVAGLTVPFQTNVPLMLLALSAFGLAMSGPASGSFASGKPLGVPLLIFLVTMGLAALFSVDPERSLRLSTPLLPGVLLFLVIGSSLSRANTLKTLYLIFSLTAAGVAAMVLQAAVTSDSPLPVEWFQKVGGTTLLVPNDVTLLALIAPLSFVVFYARPRSVAGILAGGSLMVSVVAIAVAQSRTAALALLVSLACTTALVRPRLAVPLTLGAVVLALLVDAILGFPLTAKFADMLDTRLAVWWVAWSAFLDAPLLGQGPHTFALFYQPYLEQFPAAWLPVDPRNMPWAHNLYLEMLWVRLF